MSGHRIWRPRSRLWWLGRTIKAYHRHGAPLRPLRGLWSDTRKSQGLRPIEKQYDLPRIPWRRRHFT